MKQQDKIGRQQLVDKIKYLIENLPQDEHFCLALDGEWGSGKTFVMEMLRESLSEHSEYIVINYDAWKNNFYSDPLIAILYCLLDGIKEYISILPEVKEKVKNGVLKSIKSFAKDALSAMKKSGGKVALFAHIIEGITNIVVQSGKLESHQKFADFRSYQSLLEDVKKQLNNITAAEIYDRKQTKLVIMVDEIDRCLPNEQLIVLERLHHLFDVKNCAVIVALNKKAICSNFKVQYGGDGKEYLRKFFLYNFYLRPEADTLIINLFQDFLNDFNNANQTPILQGKYETMIVSMIDQISKVTKSKIFSTRDAMNLFQQFRQIWEGLGSDNLYFAWILALMLLYWNYDIKTYELFQKGTWDRDSLIVLNYNEFGIILQEYNFGDGINEHYPIFKFIDCNQLNCFINYVRFRKDRHILLSIWKKLQSLYIPLPKFDKEEVQIADSIFREIDQRGKLIDNENEKQRN